VTESDFLQHTRDGYDRTAAMYAERFHGHLDGKPIDRAMLAGFAGLVQRHGVVADIGCGTGATSRMLADIGLDVVGIDLSPNMIAEARRLNPDLRFQVGSMTELDFDDGYFHGICAWYSVIHVPDKLLPRVFSDFRRVLRPGGWLLVAFQVGEQPREFKQVFGEDVSPTPSRCYWTRRAWSRTQAWCVNQTTTTSNRRRRPTSSRESELVHKF
jgi:SAM-dependent methyltransferase